MSDVPADAPTPGTLRLGTRSSPLALAQANMVRAAIAAHDPDLVVELVSMSTVGDRDMRAFREIGERGIFAVELERALLAGEIDAAVHSCKDLRLELPAELVIAAVLPRADARDVLCSTAGNVLATIDDLPPGASVATGSMRRSAALALLRPDLVANPVRGNVQTRLATAAERGDSACMLAAAGLDRLGLNDVARAPLAVESCVPEPAQGAIAVQMRAGDVDARHELWAALEDVTTRWSIDVERRVAAQLGGGCDAPLGVHVTGTTAWVFRADEELPTAPGGAEILSCEIDRSAAPEYVATAVVAMVAAAPPLQPDGAHA